MPATVDRGDILHLAGFRRLSPALRDGLPALVAHGEAGARCGWEPFFRALSARGLAVAWAGDDGPVRMVPRAEADRDPPHRPSLRRALDHARRFSRAWRGEA